MDNVPISIALKKTGSVLGPVNYYQKLRSDIGDISKFMPYSGIKMQGFPFIQDIYMISHSDFNLALEHIDEFFPFMLIPDALMILFCVYRNPKGFEVFVLCSGCQCGIGIIIRPFGVSLDAISQA